MKKLIKAYRSWWYARLRRADIAILWPTCCEQGKTLERARIAFLFHALFDKAWWDLGSEEAIAGAVHELEFTA